MSKQSSPSSPIPPVYGDPPELIIPDGLFDGNQPEKYSSQYFENKEIVDYFENTLYPDVRENGKGDVLFPDKDQFLSELDDALFHYDVFKSSVSSGDPNYLNEQRGYFNRLAKSVKSLSKALAGMDDDHYRRLAHAGIELYPFSREKSLSSHDFRRNVNELLRATEKVQEELKGKKEGPHSELNLLIKELGEMYERCSGRTPSVTYDEYDPDPLLYRRLLSAGGVGAERCCAPLCACGIYRLAGWLPGEEVGSDLTVWRLSRSSGG